MQASTLGSMEALLVFLRSPAVKIPVSGIALGPIHKKDILKASTMVERGKKEYAVILAFDVPVSKEAEQIAKENGVTIFKADIIYHLFDMFTDYMTKVIILYLIKPLLRYRISFSFRTYTCTQKKCTGACLFTKLTFRHPLHYSYAKRNVMQLQKRLLSQSL